MKRGNARELFGSTLTPLTRQVDLNRGPKGLRGRNSPTCTLSQNGYGTPFGGQMGPLNLQLPGSDTVRTHSRTFPNIPVRTWVQIRKSKVQNWEV